MADNFSAKFARGLNTMQHQGGSVPAPKQQSAWMAVKNYFAGDPSAQAQDQAIPPKAIEQGPNVDPYQNAASVLSGKGRIAP